MKKALMLFAEGFETVEALMVVDLLRRGGVEVSMASIDENEMVTSAQESVSRWIWSWERQICLLTMLLFFPGVCRELII